MDLSVLCCVVGVATILVLCLWRIWIWLWLQPKNKEKFLRDQGLNGNSYKFYTGDMKEMTHLTIKAKSKPMNLNHDISHRVSPFFHKAANIHGKNFFVWMGPKPLVHIAEPAMIREVLANFYQFQKLGVGNPFVKLFSRGLSNDEADEWVKHRKIINPAFHVEKLKHMVPAFYVSCMEMIHKWDEILKEESFCEVDVWPHLQTLSSDAISRTAFGRSFEEGRKIFELQKEQAKLVLKALQSFYIPGQIFLPTKNNKRMKQVNRELKTLIRGIINKRVVAMKLGEASNEDLLSILLDSNYKEIKQRENRNFGLTIDQVIEDCKLFYFAGQETTANLLVWTMILLGQHTEWQSHARAEVLNIFGKQKPDIIGLNHLKTINMIFNEVLRLYPPVVGTRRMIQKQTKLGNLTLPAQTIIHLNVLFLHDDNDLWGDDAKEFKPQRFSEGVSKVTNGQSSYLPFGGGPRICIGQNFAMLEAKMALVLILQHFCFELSPTYCHAPHTVFTLQPQFGAQLILRKL